MYAGDSLTNESIFDIILTVEISQNPAGKIPRGVFYLENPYDGEGRRAH